MPRDVDLARLAGRPAGSSRRPSLDTAVWIENGREVTLDPQGRAAPSSKTRKSDDPVLRIRRLLQDKVQPLGDYSQAVLFPNQGENDRFRSVMVLGVCERIGLKIPKSQMNFILLILSILSRWIGINSDRIDRINRMKSGRPGVSRVRPRLGVTLTWRSCIDTHSESQLSSSRESRISFTSPAHFFSLL